jgi:hypothetical protein
VNKKKKDKVERVDEFRAEGREFEFEKTLSFHLDLDLGV